MRERRRIASIMSKLEYVWQQNPDWRFGQLLWNIDYLERSSLDTLNPLVEDPFHYEDDKLEALLDAAIYSHRENRDTA